MSWPQDQPRPSSIQTWRPGHSPPSVAIEIVSEDWRKDYEELPPKCEQLDVEELFIYDIEGARRSAAERRSPDRRRVWRRIAEAPDRRRVAARSPTVRRRIVEAPDRRRFRRIADGFAGPFAADGFAGPPAADGFAGP